jgi:hypothetical protein
MENPNFTKGHLFADEVNVDLDVLRMLVVDGVGRHVDGADIVLHHFLGTQHRLCSDTM